MHPTTIGAAFGPIVRELVEEEHLIGINADASPICDPVQNSISQRAQELHRTIPPVIARPPTGLDFCRSALDNVADRGAPVAPGRRLRTTVRPHRVGHCWAAVNTMRPGRLKPDMLP